MENRELLLNKLGFEIKQARQVLGISQEELAFRCEFDRTYISLLERGKRNPNYLNLVKLFEQLHLDIVLCQKNPV